MKVNSKEEILKEFRKCPNIGPAIAEDLYDLGFRHISELKNKDPENLYTKMEKDAGAHIDRCMLYVLRALVYMAKHPGYNKKGVMWWNFKD